MTYSYYVAVDSQGRPGLAATKRQAVLEVAAESGAEVFRVTAPNAFLARRLALESWLKRRSLSVH